MAMVEAARACCNGRLVVCHEGGYSPTYAPFCSLAVIETLSGETTEVVDPLLDWYEKLGGQSLEAHQASIIDRAARQLQAHPIRPNPNPPRAR